MVSGQLSARRRIDQPSIYLIQPTFPPSYWGMEHFMDLTHYDAVFPPLGLLTLAALTPPQFRVDLCDENAGEVVNFDTDADIVGITGYIIQMKRAMEIADEFRRRGKIVIIGGPMANLVPEECRQHCDVLFEGEGEYIWPQFLKDYQAGHHADHYVEHEKIHMPDSPAPRLNALTKTYAQGIVQCTRGCPFTCEFCDIIVMYGRKMRFKPTAQVLQEVKNWHRRGVAQVFFADDNFVGNRAYAKELLREIIAWNSKQRHPLAFYTQASIDMSRDDELLQLMKEANFSSVFIGVESPRKSSLAETKKMQNERIDLVEAIHKIQSNNLFISAGMIVGFDSDDLDIFDEQYEFLQAAQIPIVMLSVLLAVPKTPLYKRLKAAGRLLNLTPDGKGSAHYVGTAGGTNFHPMNMTREELKEGQQRLYQRLYSPEAFGARLLGNLSRFNNVTFRPESPKANNLKTLYRLFRHYWGNGPAARKFFFNSLYQATRKSPRLIAQMSTYMGMYLHFCQVHGQAMDWNPWLANEDNPQIQSGRIRVDHTHTDLTAPVEETASV